MDELTLTGHLLELSRSLDDYRAATRKMEVHFADQIERLWQDAAAQRDELHESVEALSNRIEANSPRGIFACDPDESEGLRDDAA